MDLREEIVAIEGRLAQVSKTPADLCAQAGVARSTWQRWKSGATTPNFRTWQGVQAACDAICGVAGNDAA